MMKPLLRRSGQPRRHRQSGNLVEPVRPILGHPLERRAREKPGEHNVEGCRGVGLGHLDACGPSLHGVVDRLDLLPGLLVWPVAREGDVVNGLWSYVYSQLPRRPLPEPLREGGDGGGLHVEEDVARLGAYDLSDSDRAGVLVLLGQQVPHGNDKLLHLAPVGLEEAGDGDVQGVQVRRVRAKGLRALIAALVEDLPELGVQARLEVHQVGRWSLLFVISTGPRA
mmetsp:Transcript_10751/g.29193  ORF Transcript_10751/g.29193 Transcript_10751/m.29193 type:complete len:225 (-) Transcript_10751:218-892(-)